MIDHDEQVVLGDEYTAFLAQMYPDQLDQFGHISMAKLRNDCIAQGASRFSVEHTWTDGMMVYFLAKQAGLLSV